MSGETTRLPFWRGWTPQQAAFELISPLLIVGAVAWCVHLVRIHSVMFDNANIGSTVVGTLAFGVAAIVGGYGTSRLRASMSSVTLRGACPCCGDVRQRTFEGPASEKAPPTPCGACIAYLRANGDEIHEEAPEEFEMFRTPYVLTAAQYKPAVKRTNRGHFTFDMPTICAICGDAHAPHKRDIGNGDSLGADLGALGAVAGIAGTAFVSPSEYSKNNVSAGKATAMANENSTGLSHLKAPVCDKHTDSEKPFGDALEYNSGKLEFASYRYYKAFCALNHIERVTG